MFKQILDALTTKYKGVDARILTRMARKLAKEVKEADEIQEKVDEITMMDFIEIEGSRRANAAKEQATKDYESKYNLKNGKPAEQADKTAVDTDDLSDTDDDDDDDDTPLAAKANKSSKSGRSKSQTKMENQLAQLTAAVTALTGTVKGMQQERTAKTRRQQYEQLFEGVDEKVKNRYMRNFDRLTFKDEADFDGWLDEMTPQITEELQGVLTEQAQGTAGAQQGGMQGTQRRMPATPPLGGRGRSKTGELSPEFKAYQAKQKAKKEATRYSTMAGLPQMQNPMFDNSNTSPAGSDTPQQ